MQPRSLVEVTLWQGIDSTLPAVTTNKTVCLIDLFVDPRKIRCFHEVSLVR